MLILRSGMYSKGLAQFAWRLHGVGKPAVPFPRISTFGKSQIPKTCLHWSAYQAETEAGTG